MDKKYFHYTTELRLIEIIESGKIMLATAGIEKREKPCAWVSTNPYWEHSATKSHLINGIFKSLTFEEQLNIDGCARIEVKPIGLYKWGKLIHKIRMEKNIALALEEAGLEMGGQPLDWHGSLYPIGIDRWIKAEIYRNSQWIDYKIFNNNK
jgi:hypothetical protein